MKQTLIANTDVYLGDDGEIHETPVSGILIARKGQEIDPALLKRHPVVGAYFGAKAKSAKAPEPVEPAPAADKTAPEGEEPKKAEDPKHANKSETPAAKNKRRKAKK